MKPLAGVNIHPDWMRDLVDEPFTSSKLMAFISFYIYAAHKGKAVNLLTMKGPSARRAVVPARAPIVPEITMVKYLNFLATENNDAQAANNLQAA